jgi:hypothetical protein
MSSNDLFTNSPGRSCVTQLIEVLDDWLELMDNGFSIDTIYLDFSKAFDTVPHQRLFLKIEKLGFEGSLLNLIKIFLTGRNQCVRINSTTSTLSDVVSGVPQGSVLVPVLFLIFINDLPDIVNGIVKIFADDCKTFSKISSVNDHDRLQNNLDELYDWSNTWKLKFNAAKCKVLHFNPDINNHYRYTMLDSSDYYVALDEVDEEKDLGVTFQSNLKFDKHISSIIAKAQRVLSLIYHSFDLTCFLFSTNQLSALYWNTPLVFGPPP